MAEEPEAASNRGDDDGDVIEPDESALGKVYKLTRLLVALHDVDVIPANAATAITTAWHNLSAADKVTVRFPSRTVGQQMAGTWMHKAPYKAPAVPGADNSSKTIAGTITRASTSPGCHSSSRPHVRYLWRSTWEQRQRPVSVWTDSGRPCEITATSPE